MSCSADGRGSGRDCGIERGPRGVMLVGALSMNSVIRVGTDCGVTLSITTNAGKRSTVVGCE